MCAYFYLNRGIRKENTEERLLTLGIAGFFFGQAVSRIFYFFSDYQLIGTYSGHTFYSSFYENITPVFEFYLQSAYVSVLIGLIFYILAFELVIKNTKYVLTLISIAITILVIIDMNFQYTYGFIPIFFSFIIIIWLSIKSGKEFQTVSGFILMGFLLLLVGGLLSSREPKELSIIPINIAPLLFIIGALVAITPSIIDIEDFGSPVLLWLIMIIFSIGLLSVSIFSLFFIKTDLFLSGGVIIGIFISTILLGFSLYRIRMHLKPEEITIGFFKNDAEVKNFLKLYAKPKKITEEEVSFYRKQTKCLVCKGIVKGFNYLCRECEALYCDKCVRSLIKIENICWACSSTLDKREPVKKLKTEGKPSTLEEEEEEEERRMGKKGKKKKKPIKNPLTEEVNENS